MHELAICHELLAQVERIARSHGARAVERIEVSAGELSGVEPDLLERAFEVARAGTVAHDARLDILRSPVLVRCRVCMAESEVPPNRLVCGMCGNWRVDVVQGEDLLLMSVDLVEGTDRRPSSAQSRQRETDHHV